MKKSNNGLNVNAFADGLRKFPNSQSKMSIEQRQKASKDLTSMYLSRYYIEWRLTKILTNQKLLEQRHEFYNDIIEGVRQWDDLDGEATIAQEIRNGLYFDSIAQAVQYVEDLFALISAAKQPDFFIRNVITYSAGQITNQIKNYRSDINLIPKTFNIPTTLELSNENQVQFDMGIQYLASLMEDITAFYIKYEFFYNQYKHGLAVAMRPLGNKYTNEQIEKAKTNELQPYLVVYDNLNINAAFKKGSFAANQPMLVQVLTENVMPFIGCLQDENNYLRLAFPPDYPNFDINTIITNARKTRMCLSTFINNYFHRINAKDSFAEFQLPNDYSLNRYFICTNNKSDTILKQDIHTK